MIRWGQKGARVLLVCLLLLAGFALGRLTAPQLAESRASSQEDLSPVSASPVSLPDLTRVLLQPDPVIEYWLPHFAAAAGQESEAISAEELLGPCEVTKLVDGDTIDVRCGNAPQRIRLLNIDTPESSHMGYSAASHALASLLGEGQVRLAFEAPGQPTRGKYGRLLAYVYDLKGRNLNLEMVKLGWTPYYRKYGDGRMPNSFAAAHLDSYFHRRGLWVYRWPPEGYKDPRVGR